VTGRRPRSPTRSRTQAAPTDPWTPAPRNGTYRAGRGLGRLDVMSQADRAPTEPFEADRATAEQREELDDVERAWLEERLEEYRELLIYLREH